MSTVSHRAPRVGRASGADGAGRRRALVTFGIEVRLCCVIERTTRVEPLAIEPPVPVDHRETAAPLAARTAPSAWKFRIAVVTHYRAVYRLARALLDGDREAEDVTQETFLRYWLANERVERPREWLLKVARNGCLDRLRRSGRCVYEAEPSTEPSDERDPAWHYERRELAARLAAQVAALPEPQRSLVVLFDLHGLDGATCARILDLNINQLKVYLHRARRRLRRSLEQQP
jgi:RNA polymerase sigma-70 factor, ECF subfamily